MPILASQQARDYRNRMELHSGIPLTVERLERLIRRLKEFKRCSECTFASEDENFCREHGIPLVSLSYDSGADTLKLLNHNVLGLGS